MVVTSEEQIPSYSFDCFGETARDQDAAGSALSDEEAEGQWVWVDGTPMRYSNWSPVGRQPNNKQGLEHYAVVFLAHR